MYEVLLAALPYVVGTGVLAFVGSVIRWAVKVEQGFAQQAVVNTKTVAALDLITERLNGHAALDDVRDEAMSNRVAILERSVGIAPVKHRL